MSTETQHLRLLARRVVQAATSQIEIEAALLAGSAGRGNADRFSDLDLLFYVNRVPTNEEVAAIRDAAGGRDALRRWEATDFANGEEFQLDGVRTEMSFTLVEHVEELLDQLLIQLDDIASHRQKFLSGLAEGLPLYGDGLVEQWQRRVRKYPEPFRREMIKRHWDFFPLWYHDEAMSLRDSELWRLDVLLEGTFNILGVLAALNRLYFARFELKRTRDLVGKMTLAPPQLADRIEALFHLPREAAAQQFGVLVSETLDLVSEEMPDLALSLPFPLDARRQRWSLPATPPG